MSDPQFANLEAVLRCEVPSRPTLFEFFLNDRLHEQLGGPVDAAQPRLPYERRLIRAFAAAGYDYATVGVPGFGFARAAQAHAASISQNEGKVIRDRASFEGYAWPDPETADYAALDELAADLPAGMKLLVPGPSGVLENAINLVGYEDLCLLVFDDPALAKDVFDAIGSRIARYYELAAPHAAVGAIMGNDDWGHKTQTMLPPAIMRKFVFPWHEANVAAAHAAGKPIILHSCGARHEVMEDVIAMGYDGVHSYEDLIQPVEQAYEQYVGRIAILGGIDVDFLCRSDAEAIELRCEAMLARSAFRGGYALGSGNSIPYYVPDESYYTMIDTVRRYRV